MSVRFSSVFKKQLLDAETQYAAISAKLGDDFHARVTVTGHLKTSQRGSVQNQPPCEA